MTSGLLGTDRTPNRGVLCPFSLYSNDGTNGDHTNASWSKPDDMTNRKSGQYASDNTPFLCPFSVWRKEPVHMSHMQMVESKLALATLSSCWMATTSITMSEWPAMQLVSSRDLMSHECTSPVVEPEYRVVYWRLHARDIWTWGVGQHVMYEYCLLPGSKSHNAMVESAQLQAGTQPVSTNARAHTHTHTHTHTHNSPRNEVAGGRFDVFNSLRDTIMASQLTLESKRGRVHHLDDRVALFQQR